MAQADQFLVSKVHIFHCVLGIVLVSSLWAKMHDTPIILVGGCAMWRRLISLTSL